MNIQDIYNLAVQKGIEADFRPKEQIQDVLSRRQKKFEKLSEQEKISFDKESLVNPYSDTRILHVADNRDIKRVLVGVDIDVGEILLAKELGNIDLVISHHPMGRALGDMHEVMDLQADKLRDAGVPIHVGESLMKERMAEISRVFNPRNLWRTIDAAKLLNINLICLHTVADNIAAKVVEDAIKAKNPERIEDVLEVLQTIGEFEQANALGVGPRIFVGSPENRTGKIFVGMTGGTEPSAKVFEKMSHAGIGTVVDMHVSEEHKKEAEAAHLNIVVTNHMPSDSIGMNLILDELEKQGIEIIPCGGLFRVSRKA